MTRDEILILAKAGFNATQIAALNSIQTPATVPEPAPSPSPSPSPAPAHATATDTATDAVLKQLQLLGISSSSQPPKQTTDDILASIINPPEV